jgi:hypothetical protein
MYFLNTIDEKERFLDLKFDSTKIGQSNSPWLCYSYLYDRQLLKKDYGYEMGFDRDDLYKDGFVIPTHKRSELKEYY